MISSNSILFLIGGITFLFVFSWFRDVTTLFNNAEGFQECIDRLTEPYKKAKVDKVIGLEARGFIIGGAILFLCKMGLLWNKYTR